MGPYCLEYRLPKNLSRQEQQMTKVQTVGIGLTFQDIDYS